MRGKDRLGFLRRDYFGKGYIQCSLTSTLDSPEAPERQWQWWYVFTNELLFSLSLSCIPQYLPIVSWPHLKFFQFTQYCTAIHHPAGGEHKFPPSPTPRRHIWGAENRNQPTHLSACQKYLKLVLSQISMSKKAQYLCPRPSFTPHCLPIHQTLSPAGLVAG